MISQNRTGCMVMEIGKTISKIALAIFVLGAFTLSVRAQQFESIPMPEKYVIPEIPELASEEKIKLLKEQVKKAEALRKSDLKVASDIAKTGSGAIDTYFQEFVLPSMTQLDDNTLSSLGKLRAEFLKTFIVSASPANRKAIIDRLVLPSFQKIAEENYHPSARLNAVLLIGDLNDAEGNSSTKSFPIPNSASLKYLWSLVEKNDTPEFLRVGAMTGIHRIAEIEGNGLHVDAADIKKVSDYAMLVVEAKAPGQESWNKDVSYWLKRRSIQILGFLKDPGPKGEVTAALNKIIANNENPIMMRTDAITALGQLKITDKVQATQAADNLITFAANALEAEAIGIHTLIEEYVAITLLLDNKFLIESDVTGKSGKVGGPGLGGAGDDADSGQTGGEQKGAGTAQKPKFDLPNYALNSIRRQTKAYLYFTRRTLTDSLGEMIDDSEKVRISKAVKVLDQAIKDTDIGLVDLGKKPDDKQPYEEELKTRSVADLMHERLMSNSSELKTLMKSEPVVNKKDQGSN